MDVLCTDKTGTLTMDHIILERHCDVVGSEATTSCATPILISHFQTGLKNVLDRAVLEHISTCTRNSRVDEYHKVDEIPFDFRAAMMSVVVEGPERPAPAAHQGRARGGLAPLHALRSDGEISPMEPIR